jgi:hypothetical protein
MDHVCEKSAVVRFNADIRILEYGMKDLLAVSDKLPEQRIIGKARRIELIRSHSQWLSLSRWISN